MTAEIITIGDELLIGQTIDTNSAWIGEKLNLIGVKIDKITSIRDNEKEIINSLYESKNRANIVIITGGLGPTKDDITKLALCNFFDTELELNHDILEDLKERYSKFNVPLNKSNKDQALLPKKCTILPNKNGSASGMWFEKDEVVFISLPGVPYEMKGILSDFGFPKIIEHFKTPNVIHKTIKTIGIPESILAQKLEQWEIDLNNNNFKLAYLPSPGLVKLRISGVDNRGETLNFVQKKIDELTILLGNCIYGKEKDTLEKVVASILIKQNKTICFAESCTGGNLSKIITNISGASVYFRGSIVSYDNNVKINLLNIPKEDIINYGAVSKTVVEQMAKNVRKLMKTDYSIATSGIAGPTGGTTEKPVGTVWIAVSSKTKTISKKFITPYNNRERNIHTASIYALNLLRTEFL